MLDTVTVWFPVSPTPRQLQDWVSKVLQEDFQKLLLASNVITDRSNAKAVFVQR